MLLNLLMGLDVESIDIAGFDGFIDGGTNFYLKQMDRCLNGEYQNKTVYNILQKCYSKLPINFVTKSIFDMKGKK